MELLPLGPVVIIDTPGIDDEGKLGELRVRKAKQTLNKTDLAIVVVDATIGMSEVEKDLIELIKNKDIDVSKLISKVVDPKECEQAYYDLMYNKDKVNCIIFDWTNY